MSGTLHLAQARSNRGRRGRKKDFPDAERLVKRLMADELILSFVPDAEQRLWRTVTRRKYQLTRDKVRLQNQLEALLEEAHIKLSSLVSDLLGVSARRMLKAVADGGSDPAALAALADKKLRATQAQLCDALGACAELQPVYRRLLKMFLEELQLIEQQIGQLDQEMAALLSQHQEAVQRLAEIPGLGVDSAQQIIAEVGATAATFPSGKQLSSWVGACPGDEESAEVSQSHRSAAVNCCSSRTPLFSQNNKNALSRAPFPAKPGAKSVTLERGLYVKLRAFPFPNHDSSIRESTIFSVMHNIVARIHRVSTGESTFALVVYFHFDNVSKVCSLRMSRNLARSKVVTPETLPA